MEDLSRNDILKANGILYSTDLEKFTRTFIKEDITITIPYDRVPTNKQMVEWFGDMKYIEYWDK
jgi:hypothetical protein